MAQHYRYVRGAVDRVNPKTLAISMPLVMKIRRAIKALRARRNDRLVIYDDETVHLVSRRNGVSVISPVIFRDAYPYLVSADVVPVRPARLSRSERRRVRWRIRWHLGYGSQGQSAPERRQRAI